jgi:short chain dehydrogenase
VGLTGGSSPARSPLDRVAASQGAVANGGVRDRHVLQKLRYPSVAWTRPRIALVTGANQNLGRALVTGLDAQMTPFDRVLLTGRDPARVGTAARELSSQIPDGAVIEPRVLDVRDPHAIRSLAADVGEVDVVFANAAARMSPDDEPADEVDVVADTNNTATNMMLRELAPRIRDGGRFIIVASALGTLDKLPASVRPRFAEAAAADLDAVNRLVDDWRHSVKAGRAVEQGRFSALLRARRPRRVGSRRDAWPSSGQVEQPGLGRGVGRHLGGRVGEGPARAACLEGVS